MGTPDVPTAARAAGTAGPVESLTEAGAWTDAASVVGPGCWVRAGTRLTASALGSGCFLGFRVRLSRARLGAGCLVASGAVIGDRTGGTTVVGAGVWVGARARIAPGVVIGDGAVIAAGADVSDDVPADTVVVGRPATVLRRRAVIEDGLPDISGAIGVVRDRRPSGSLPEGWRAGAGCRLEADLAGGPRVTLGAEVIAIGRATGGVLGTPGGVRVGAGSAIGDRVVLEGPGGIDIGAGTTVRDDVLIVSSGHDAGRRSLPLTPEPVRIGSRVVIGAGATVIGPVSIGDGAVIEPAAVVVKDVAAHAVSGGVFGGMTG